MRELLKILKEIRDLLMESKADRQAEKEEKERAENERLLVEYAKRHNKKLPAGAIQNGRDAMDQPVHSDGDLVPYNLNEREKKILQLFYDS
jgi:hypothetical protein